MRNILFIDDERKLLRILQSTFEKKGYRVYTAPDGNEARRRISETSVDIIFLDFMLPDCTGLELLQEFLPLYPQKAFILMTAYGNVEIAVSAMKAGAFDFIVKPATLDVIEIAIQKASEWLEMKQENQLLKKRLEDAESAHEMISFSPAMKRIVQIVERVANTDATVLLQGESGTGKSMLARKIHELSARNKAPFVSINCAAIPEQLLESELFGYEKGAFTGANTNRQGKFEAADGGTIFLDEIGEISPSLQAKLLQVTQEKSFMRLGSNVPKQVDVRIISATNRDLKKMVEQGKFREDLYYRLNIVDIFIPPLRERKDDIPFLVEDFLEKHRKRYGKKIQMSRELLKVLMEYDWPGNVRELENALERAVVLCAGTMLSIEDFPQEIQVVRRRTDEWEEWTFQPGKPLPDQLDEIEKRFILQALRQTNGHAASAARLLGISRQSLLYKMNKHFIQ